MKDLFQCTAALTGQKTARSIELATVVGCCSRGVLARGPASAILDAYCKRMAEFPGELGDQMQVIPREAKRELKVLASLAVFFKSVLGLAWHTTVYATDASEGGFGAVATRSR